PFPRQALDFGGEEAELSVFGAIPPGLDVIRESETLKAGVEPFVSDPEGCEQADPPHDENELPVPFNRYRQSFEHQWDNHRSEVRRDSAAAASNRVATGESP